MTTRRRFLHKTSAFAALASLGFHTSTKKSAAYESALSRPGIGAIGLRYQGSVIAHKASAFGDIVAVCDVDKNVRDQAKASFGSTAFSCEDYRELLDRSDVDLVTIGAPDHWHSKMLIDACRAQKDVYCEKPLTLTIDEGKIIRDVVQQTERVVQVGSWQRSDHRFRLAVEMIRSGRIGTLRRVEVVLGKNETSPAFEPTPVPAHVNWDLWQGQTPSVPYIEQRMHYTFRWWYEYSGGQMTDWGAHHIDIAQWAIDSLPTKVDGQCKLPKINNAFNVATDFEATITYENGVVMTVNDHGDNGILFSGDQGRIFVNRGKITGAPVEALKQNPLPREQWSVYQGDNLDRPERMGKLDAIINHMGNFFDCVQTRSKPISDVESQHRAASTCHLANISMRLGQPLQWDAQLEQCIDSNEANQWLRRDQRSGFEVA